MFNKPLLVTNHFSSRREEIHSPAFVPPAPTFFPFLPECQKSTSVAGMDAALAYGTLTLKSWPSISSRRKQRQSECMCLTSTNETCHDAGRATKQCGCITIWLCNAVSSHSIFDQQNSVQTKKVRSKPFTTQSLLTIAKSYCRTPPAFPNGAHNNMHTMCHHFDFSFFVFLAFSILLISLFTFSFFIFFALNSFRSFLSIFRCRLRSSRPPSSVPRSS